MHRSGEGKTRDGVTLRAVAIALLIIPLNNYWLYMCESVKYTGHPTCLSIFYNAVVILLILVAANAVVRRFAPSRVLAQGELLTIYMMIALASVPASHDMLQVLIPELTYPFKFATAENQWGKLFMEHLPRWLMVHDQVAVDGFYQGATTFYQWRIVKAWLLPTAMWTLFVTDLAFVLLCMTVLLRKQWTEQEKLTYPLVTLPLDMTTERTPFFKNKLLWTGMALAGFLDLLQGLGALYPSFPMPNMKSLDLMTYATTSPWNAVGWSPIRFYPFAVGLGALLPVDLSFSAWFFHLFLKAQLVLSAAAGWSQIPRFPYVNEQSFGSLIGLFVFSIWTGRRYFADLLSNAFARKSDMGDANEAMRYRTAAWGALAGTIGLFAFVLAMGMSPWLVPIVFAIYFALSIAQTRMRAELGPPVHDFYLVGPDSMLPVILGPANLGSANLTALSMMFWFNRTYRSHPMPIQLEGFKMAERSGIGYRKLAAAMMLAVVAGMITAFWSQLHVAYQLGAMSKMMSPKWFGLEPYMRLESWLKSPQPANGNALWAIGAGLVFTLLLNAIRMRVMWFPFHPVGYALAGNWSMNLLWVSMLIAWLIKLLLLRYGGLRLYRAAIPLFLGLILGEFVMAAFWNVFGIFRDVQTFNIFP